MGISDGFYIGVLGALYYAGALLIILLFMGAIGLNMGILITTGPSPPSE